MAGVSEENGGVEWFFYRGLAQAGPVGEDELRRMMARGEIARDAMVFREWMPSWRSAEEVFGEEAFAAPLPVAEAPRFAATPPRPWLRYWARSFDMLLFALILAAAAAPVLAAAGVALEKVSPAFFAPPATLLYALLEAWMMSRFGATPGKWLLGIVVRFPDGSLPTYREALRRSALVAWRGQGLGLPIVGVVANVLAYARLGVERRTTWDRDSGFVVVHLPVRPARASVVAGVLIGATALAVAAALAAGQLPGA